MIKTIFTVFSILLLLLFSYISFSGKLYYFLQPTFGVPRAYVLDQGLFLFIILFLFIFYQCSLGRSLFSHLPGGLPCRQAGRMPKAWKVVQMIKNHAIYIILLLFFIFASHGYVLEYYFFAEDVSSILSPANNELVSFPFTTMNNGYPLLPFIFSFLFFKTNAFGYNIISLSLFSICVLSTYWFAYLIRRKKYVAFLAGLLFATTPSYIDMFTWQASVQGMSLVLALGICSLIFLIYYQRNSSSIYFFLSLLFFASTLKIGFVRIAGLLFPLAFLSILPLYKNSIWSRIFHFIPYLLLWIGFIYYRFGIELFLAPFALFRQNVSTPVPTSSYFPALSYYMTHLFLPSYIARQFITFVRNIPRITGSAYEIPGVIFIIGIFIMTALLVIGCIALFIKDVRTKWLFIFSLLFIFSGLFYVPLFGTVPRPESLDSNFIRMVPPYGPGSRYVFFSAVGAGIFLSIIMYSLHRSKKRFSWVISFLLVILSIAGGGLLSFSAHKSIVEKISRPDRFFFDKFFSLVPIDGKKKLVISLNPKGNAIENNVGGATWLYGFYKTDELIYANSINEARMLVSQDKYNQSNVYAFYDNPETLAFTDISSQIRKLFFSKTFYVGEKNEIPFLKQKSESTFSNLDTQYGKKTIVSRGLLESKDLNLRVFEEKKLHFTITNENVPGKYPYSDILLTDSNKRLGFFWSIIQENRLTTFKNPMSVPSEFTLSAFNYQSLANIPRETKKEIIAISQNRERLRDQTVVTVSNKVSGDKRINEQSLIDGLYTTEPKPATNQTFYMSNGLPATIVFALPYAVSLGRISVNTSKSYTELSPTDLDIFVSLDGVSYQKVGSIVNKAAEIWSPNNGVSFTIVFDGIRANFIKVVVNNTLNKQAVMFDEIVIDDMSSIKYTNEQISEYKNNAFLYVEDQELLSELVNLHAYHNLSVIYACAEDSDWRMQKNNYQKLLPGVWNVESFAAIDRQAQEISIPINCNGSELRKILIFGAPFPSEMRVENIYIK